MFFGLTGVACIKVPLTLARTLISFLDVKRYNGGGLFVSVITPLYTFLFE